MVAQTAMLLEILHSLLGLVPSPVGTVAIQVLCPIFVVWGHLFWVPECQQHWSLFLILLPCGVMEIVRYAFYVCSLLGTVPYPLFYLRYSLFMVSYPLGTAGQILQALVGMGAHWKFASPLWYRLSMIVLLLYVPGTRRQIANMWGNRKRSFKKRNVVKQEEEEVEEQLPQGVLWPRTKIGDRSSTLTGKRIFAAAAAAGPEGARAAEKVMREKQWRFAYNRHMVDHVSQSLQSTDVCLAMARAGLACAQDSFRFARWGHPEMSMREAMETFRASAFETAELQGDQPLPGKREVTLSYGAETLGEPYYKFSKQRDRNINGLELRQQLNAWVEYGTMEADVAEALETLQLNQTEWLDLSDMYFVLLGAGSAMGPLRFLLSLGANVIAVARPTAFKSIFQLAKSSPGKLIFPVKAGTDWQRLLEEGDLEGLAQLSGCDLMTQTPEIATWVGSIAPGRRLTIGNYTYLDASLYVQITVACDCIIEHACKARRDTAVAFLGTPTDAHVVPEGVAAAIRENYVRASWWMKFLEAVGVLKPNKPIAAGGLHFVDTISIEQGQNYILAKRLHHWRAMVARTDGHVVSSNVGPSTATSSVKSNARIAATLGGMHIFRPMEVAYQELSLSVMGALLIHDIRNPRSAAQPSTPLHHPLCLFQATGFHGGMWRCPYTPESIAVPSVVVYYLSTLWPQLIAAGAGAAAVVQYGLCGTLPWGVHHATSLVPAAWPQPVSALLAALGHGLAVPF
eukprot:CAMPEP_0115544248 /NCGR_PEP_ID=MMETSP0271-20121206/91992_1 /TAXON_ID=71861 /ORGANISM="Scrippsiella trochoidea, Strain CCMP3099" /LENGTH=739 /DNA_ID=CAMNT_0002977561 /DNA_START=1 /DNA_END=2220 /DNA_ORIENTATION=-